VGVVEGMPLHMGKLILTPLHTPGHTDDHFSFVVGDRVFTGDALLIDGCGRTDFQNGSAEQLYRSVTEKLFTLPDDCLVYPGHDYEGRRVSSIAQEKALNKRLGGQRLMGDFVKLMGELNLPYPKFIDHAVPGNRKCGVCPTDLPDNMKAYCGRMTESPQG
jgi:glyoxylase-like metal-dependent hydrolase (beta-lactamase superfamily II)